jgi:hypothetical protein
MLLCERCFSQGKKTYAVSGERFCENCKGIMLSRLRKAGYFTHVPFGCHKHVHYPRSKPARRCIEGPGSFWDNVIRAYEDNLGAVETR